jgi:Zn-dependent protease
VDSGMHLFGSILIWAAAGFVLLRGMQYVLVARVFLTSPAGTARFEPMSETDIPSDERRILESADADLRSAGFRLLFVGQCGPLTSYSTQPEFFRAFVAQDPPIRALIGRQTLPELGAVVSIELETPLADGRSLATRNWQSYETESFPGRLEESMAGADVGRLQQRHLERLAAGNFVAADSHPDAAAILQELAARAAALRARYRARSYTAPTSDPDRDRFTLRGALVLAHLSIKQARGRRSTRQVEPQRQSAPVTEHDRQLRVAADVMAARRMALHPSNASIPNPALWAMMLGTAAVFFLGLSVLWSPALAAIVLAVVAFHEAGHAVAMRLAGYRDVNIFFVPFVGALTVGREVGATIRQRFVVMLAGPVPGLWLAVLAFSLLPRFDGLPLLRPAAVMLLAINALNLLPLTPLDGGRALELLTPPDSVLRVGIQAVSGAALLSIGLYFNEGFLIVLGVLWLFLLRRQSGLLRLRQRIARQLAGRSDPAVILQVACATLATPAYASWRGAARINTARALLQQFSAGRPTGTDRFQATLMYVFAWIPAALALLMWRR